MLNCNNNNKNISLQTTVSSFLEKRIIIIALLFAVTLNGSCTECNLFDVIIQSGEQCVFTDAFSDDLNDTTSVFLEWRHPALARMRKRAELIGNIKWTPVNDVPKRNGVFHQGKEVSGIPYSSVKELDKFVGQEVSFYTFLSAVNNPRSVLYTENAGMPPYNGTNCATYYGSVCSMTVNFALGLGRPYETIMYGSLPCIKKVAKQDLNHAAPGDIVYINSRHVFLITDIIKNSDDSIINVNILECAGNSAFIKSYSKQKFQTRLDSCSYVLYRYTDLYKLDAELVDGFLTETALNTSIEAKSLCLNRGDKVSYSDDEDTIVINVLEDGYEKINVFRIIDDNSFLVEERMINHTPDVLLTGLSAGTYKVFLSKNDGTISDAVFFEKIQTRVSFSKCGRYIDIKFNSTNAVPDYIVFCKNNGSRRFITDITDEDKVAGHKVIKCEASTDSLYLKVFFKGEYGRVSNVMIPLQ